MSYRYMRTILFFDLPSVTKLNKRDYRRFIKELKLEGFYMLQESVYVRMALDSQSVDFVIKKIKKILPSEGFVMTLNITEKQFNSMEILLGEIETDIINSDERVVTL